MIERDGGDGGNGAFGCVRCAELVVEPCLKVGLRARLELGPVRSAAAFVGRFDEGQEGDDARDRGGDGEPDGHGG